MRATRDNLGFLLAKALQRWNELLAAGFRRGGFAEVRPAYGSVLLPLFEEDGLRLSELAARSRLSKQAMTTLVRTLEARRLIVRRPDPDDGRAARVYLTLRARRFQATAEHVLATLDRRVEQRLSRDRLDALRDAVKTLMTLGDGAAYVFTQFQTPGMPDDVFTGQVHALREELLILKALLEGRTVEAAPSCAPVR